MLSSPQSMSPTGLGRGPERLPGESNAAFGGLRGHEALLRGDFLVKRPDLQNSVAAEHGVSQGPLFRKVGARQGAPESSRIPIKKKLLRKSGQKGLTMTGQPRKTRERNRTSDVSGQNLTVLCARSEALRLQLPPTMPMWPKSRRGRRGERHRNWQD